MNVTQTAIKYECLSKSLKLFKKKAKSCLLIYTNSICCESVIILGNWFKNLGEKKKEKIKRQKKMKTNNYENQHWIYIENKKL